MQGLAAGEIRVETFTVSSVDGTAEAGLVHHPRHPGRPDPDREQCIRAPTTPRSRFPFRLSHGRRQLARWEPSASPAFPTATRSTTAPCSTTAHWEVSAADLGTLALVPRSGAHQQSLVLHVSVASIEGGHQSVPSAQMTVNVAAGAG